MYNDKNVAREPDDPWPTMALVKFRLYREKPTTPILFLREPCIRPHALFQGRGSNPGRATSQSAALAIRPQYDASLKVLVRIDSDSNEKLESQQP